MQIVTEHFKAALGYDVDDISAMNLGYDLVAVQGDTTLCIEVKGRSGSAVMADFTFNEFDKIRLENAEVPRWKLSNLHRHRRIKWANRREIAPFLVSRCLMRSCLTETRLAKHRRHRNELDAREAAQGRVR
jgi:hypothetical protein